MFAGKTKNLTPKNCGTPTTIFPEPMTATRERTKSFSNWNYMNISNNKP